MYPDTQAIASHPSPSLPWPGERSGEGTPTLPTKIIPTKIA